TNHGQTIFLPFASKFSSAYTPTVRGSINGKAFTFPVDTGSTGLIIGAPLLPNVKLDAKNEAKYQRGWEFLDSSSLLYTGRFVPLNVTFYGKTSARRAVTQVPVLVVQSVVKCPGYNPTTGKGVCPKGKSVKSTANLSHITYMGVGFGRNVAGSGIDFGTPDHNPFLNVIDINGHSTARLRTGYTLSTKGVYLGLTEKNTINADWVKLERGATENPRDWAGVRMSFKVNGAGDFKGTALVDTGVPQMYLQSAPIGTLPNVTIPNPAPSPAPKYTRRVTKGTHLAFAFPNFERGVAGYDFAVGDAAFPSQPKYVQPVSIGSGPFVNTGRNFLFGFTILFDAVDGRFGF
ncbi:uncharacterized protein K460DRAFT_259778, partial [Cucurbitaria berberidis CBS 394.84]